ncbi:MAG: hypothetical protein JWO03_4 [Bacteroidetes bacterium]|nr:hypothetical protein [Bacteroidota bacterium]
MTRYILTLSLFLISHCIYAQRGPGTIVSRRDSLHRESIMKVIDAAKQVLKNDEIKFASDTTKFKRVQCPGSGDPEVIYDLPNNIIVISQYWLGETYRTGRSYMFKDDSLIYADNMHNNLQHFSLRGYTAVRADTNTGKRIYHPIDPYYTEGFYTGYYFNHGKVIGSACEERAFHELTTTPAHCAVSPPDADRINEMLLSGYFLLTQVKRYMNIK